MIKIALKKMKFWRSNQGTYYKYCIILVLLSSCTFYGRKDAVLITDKDFVENYREFSPDSTMILINYSIDQGAFGSGVVGTAVLKAADTTKDINPYTLSNSLIHTKWVDSKTIAAKKDILPFVRAGELIKIDDTAINGVAVKVYPFDHIEPGSHLQIEHRETSPDGKHELIAYRYLKDDRNLNFIHVSVIAKGAKIPKYGNYFIADDISDYILYGTWDKNNTLIFYINEQDKDMIQYYLVVNRENIKYKIVTDNQKYGSKYRWISKR